MMKNRIVLGLVSLSSTMTSTVATVLCGGDYYCPDSNTCCPRDDGTYGCVPSEAGDGDAVCCTAGTFACPANYTCTASSHNGACISADGPQPDPELSAEWPYPMGLAGWQLAYHTCPAFKGDPPLFQINVGGTASDPLKFS